MRTPLTFPNYDASSDAFDQASAGATQINVVQNWFEELKQKLPTGTK